MILVSLDHSFPFPPQCQPQAGNAPVGQFVDLEGSLNDTSGLYSRSKDVLFIGNVVVSQDSVHLVEVAERREGGGRGMREVGKV